MKLTLKRTPEQVELIQAMASRDINVARQAQEIFAAFMGPRLSQVADQAPILANYFTALPYNVDEPATIPVELFSDVTSTDFVSIWSQRPGGGLGYNELAPPTEDMKIATYSHSTAHAFERKYAAQSRLDVVSACMSMMLREILYKQENYSVGPVMSALANASTNGLQHAFRTTTTDRLIPADYLDLDNRMARINTSFIKGTPVGSVGNVSDLLMSPEMVKSIRQMSFNPINTAAAPYTSALKDSLLAPESVREELFNAAGLETFMGKAIHKFNEFGVGARFNSVFAAAAGATQYAQYDGSTGAATFNGATTEIVLALDRGKDSMFKVVANDPDSNSEFTFVADDQHQVYNRSNRKIGFYGEVTEGRVILDNRVLAALLV